MLEANSNLNLQQVPNPKKKVLTLAGYALHDKNSFASEKDDISNNMAGYVGNQIPIALCIEEA